MSLLGGYWNGPTSDTNAEEVAAERLEEAKKSVKSLQEWLVSMAKAMERRKEGAFDIGWCSTMMEKALKIYNEVARANGAVLVRGKV
jgi:hypothetical protein